MDGENETRSRKYVYEFASTRNVHSLLGQRQKGRDLGRRPPNRYVFISMQMGNVEWERGKRVKKGKEKRKKRRPASLDAFQVPEGSRERRKSKGKIDGENTIGDNRCHAITGCTQ